MMCCRARMNVELGYADLNIPVAKTNDAGLKALVKRALELGYQTVALNTEVDQVYQPQRSHPLLGSYSWFI
jgi:hypothetical protein